MRRLGSLIGACDDALERYLWLKLLQIAVIDAIIIGLFIYGLDQSIHPLDLLGHIWLIGGGIFCYLVLAAVTIWTRDLEEEDDQIEQLGICPGCGWPIDDHPHKDLDWRCNSWYT